MAKYHLIDLANIDPKLLALVDQAYFLWESTYLKILSASGETLNPDCFWRSKILAIIEENDVIIGLHLYNAFDLRMKSITRHGYIENFNESQIRQIRSQGIDRVMSCEFLTVNPDFRGKVSGFSWGDVIVGLAAKVCLASSWDGMVGISRTDFKVDRMAKRIGAADTDKVIKHEIECRIVVASKALLQPSPDLQVQRMIRQLWSQIDNQANWIKSNTNFSAEMTDKRVA